MGLDARPQALRVGAVRGTDPRDLRGVGRTATYLRVRQGLRSLRRVFIALALLWGVVVDGFRPDRWDLLGAAICVPGVMVMVAPPEARTVCLRLSGARSTHPEALLLDPPISAQDRYGQDGYGRITQGHHNSQDRHGAVGKCQLSHHLHHVQDSRRSGSQRNKYQDGKTAEEDAHESSL